MANTITRTIVKTTIEYCEAVVENGAAKLANAKPIEVYGDFTAPNKSLAAIKAVLGDSAKDRNFIVTKAETSEGLYEISVEDFVKNAKLVDKDSIQSVGEQT